MVFSSSEFRHFKAHFKIYFKTNIGHVCTYMNAFTMVIPNMIKEIQQFELLFLKMFVKFWTSPAHVYWIESIHILKTFTMFRVDQKETQQSSFSSIISRCIYTLSHFENNRDVIAYSGRSRLSSCAQLVCLLTRS